MKRIGGFFEEEGERILHQADELHKALTHLRYEGKVSRGKNLRAADRSINTLIKILHRHQKLQEEIIFPYLLTHIPKHELLIKLLRADHKDIKRSECVLQRSVEKLWKASTNTPEDSKAQRFGTYLICLLRHHINLEKKSIQAVMRKELRPDEKSEITKFIAKWCLKHRRGISLRC